MILTFEGIVEKSSIDLNGHMGTHYYLDIVTIGTHKFVTNTKLKTLLTDQNQSFVISKLMCHFRKELREGDRWNLCTGVYKCDIYGFSLIHNLNIGKKVMAKFYSQCIFFDLSERKSFTLKTSNSKDLNIELMSEISDPFSIQI